MAGEADESFLLFLTDVSDERRDPDADADERFARLSNSSCDGLAKSHCNCQWVQ